MAAQALSAQETSRVAPLDAGSHATNLEEQATRIGVLWVKVGARRERRTFLLFNQVGARAQAGRACRAPRGTLSAGDPARGRWQSARAPPLSVECAARLRLPERP